MKDITIQTGLNAALGPKEKPKGTVGDLGKSFGEYLNESIEEVNKLQQEADKAIEDLAAGRNASLHETMIALEKADVSFKLMMQVRNKIIDAYHEIMRMQV